MIIEQKINSILSNVPGLKKIIKRFYQIVMYTVSPKIKSEGNVIRMTPDDKYEYFFGYYDKSPWDATDRYMLCLRVQDTTKSVAPKEEAEIILIDTQNENAFEVLATTKTWNVQQGCMLQWLGPEHSEEIIYNDFRNNKFCSVILNVKSKEERIINRPIYTVSNDGQFALTLDFSRLHRLRKGYGYSNVPDKTIGIKIPSEPCIWHINLVSNEVKPILSYSDFSNFEHRLDMDNAEHKVNHLMLNPSGNRFMVLHRWTKGNQKFTRLVTSNVDGSHLFNLSDENMTSHCCWKSDTEILAFANKPETGKGYYLMKDNTSRFIRMLPELKIDGHPSYSPDGNMIVTDTYPNRARVASVIVAEDNNIFPIARVFAPFKYDNDLRCDLHPRWNRAGNQVCFDSVLSGKRGLYTIEVTSRKEKGR